MFGWLFLYKNKMVINRSDINELIVTVTEKTTISNPFYLFEFKNKSTNVSVFCISEKISTISDRDKFNIEETDAPDPLLGQVTLQNGDYSYIIYQQSSSTNLDPANTSPAEFSDYVEIGILNVQGDVIYTTEYNGISTISTEYNG